MSLKLIVALDGMDSKQAFKLLNHLDPSHCALKVGSELFTRLGPTFISQLIKLEYRVFLDLKFHDIPNTVAQACKAAADLGVWMLTLHASGGLPMLNAAKNALVGYGEKAPLLVAVTVLTSMAEGDLAAMGVEGSINQQVLRLAQLAEAAKLDGIVCSAHEVPLIKTLPNQSLFTVTPGIRFAKDESHDQSRVVTPEMALELGSDYLVVGRSITAATNPAAAVAGLLALI